MKRIKKVVYGMVALVIVVTVGLVGVGMNYIYQTVLSADFHETVQVSWNRIQKEAQKRRVVAVIYKPGCIWCQALKKQLTAVTNQISTNGMTTQFVYVNSQSKAGRDIIEQLPFSLSSVPALVLIDKGGAVVQHINYQGTTFNYPDNDTLFSLKPGVEKATRVDDIQVNDNMIQAIQKGEWQS